MATTVERLGFASDARVLIIHADDVGFSHASNVAALEGMTRGSLTTGSALVAAPWFAETVQMCAQEPALDMGVHLALNCEYEHYRWRSISGAPSLHAPDGGQWRDVPSAVAHVPPAVARAEIFAQVQHALDCGVDVTHIDTHMGTVIMPAFLSAYVDAALEFRLPLFFFPLTDRWRAFAGEAWSAAWEAQQQRLEAAGWPLLDNIITETLIEIPVDEKEGRFRDFFATLRPGLTHFLVHPSKGSDELAAIDPSMHASRARDFELFAGPGMRAYCESLGIALVGYREIRALIREGAPGRYASA